MIDLIVDQRPAAHLGLTLATVAVVVYVVWLIVRHKSVTPGQLLYGGSLALVRISAGLLWLTNLWWKEPPDFGCQADDTGGLCDWMQRMVDHSLLPPHSWFVEEIVLPNHQLFGYLTYYGEALAGILLTLGLFSRLGALIGFVLSFNLFLGLTNYPPEWYWTYILMMLVYLTLIVLTAGRYFGLDAVVHDLLQERTEQSSVARLPARLGALAS